MTFDVSVFAINMISMMGLATGIDYSLFIVSRYREERALGRGKMDAITVTGGTASRAVLFSGLTVVLALPASCSCRPTSSPVSRSARSWWSACRCWPR